tara:strand:- start:1641 stop:1886 length:246 start_codon:yes stop_codon:yes gene_type:complete
MGKMGYISLLAKEKNLEELEEEVSGIAEMLGRTTKDVAEGFIEAQEEIENNKDNPAFKVLHKLNQKNIARGRSEREKENKK